MTTLPLFNYVFNETEQSNTILEIQLLKTLTNHTLLQPDDYLDLRLNPLKLQTSYGKDIVYLRVTGDDMSLDQIKDGNLILVDRSVTPQLGDVIACYVDGLLTVKRWHRNGPINVLVSSNPDYRPQYIRPAQQFEVIGVVIWSIRPQQCYRVR